MRNREIAVLRTGIDVTRRFAPGLMIIRSFWRIIDMVYLVILRVSGGLRFPEESGGFWG